MLWGVGRKAGILKLGEQKITEVKSLDVQSGVPTTGTPAPLGAETHALPSTRRIRTCVLARSPVSCHRLNFETHWLSEGAESDCVGSFSR